MKKCKLIFTVVTVLLLSLVMALTVSAADAPTRESAEEIFYDMGFSTWGDGYFGWSLSEPEADDVPDEVAFQYMYLSGALNDYYDDETGYYTIAYDEYIALVDKTFVNHSDMKAYLADMTDPETDVVSWFRGGFGGPETWVPTEYCVKGDYCYVTGVFADRAIEDYPDFVEMEYGKETINDGDYQAVILHDIILTLQNTEDGWKILEYRENSYHVVDDLLHPFDEEMMYRFTFEDNGNVSIRVSENTQDYFTGFYGNASLWHPEISTHSYEIVADENYEIESVVLTDANGETVIEPDEDGVYTFEAVGVGSLKVTTKGIPAIKEYDGGLAYYIGNDIATDYTGLVEFGDVTYYVENGLVKVGYTGLVYFNDIWYYVENGILNLGYTGLTNYYNTWYYVECGVLNWNYTGLTCYYNTWYYVENGVLNWDYTGLTNYYGVWYYVENGVLNWNYTGLTNYYGVWYYVENGVLNWGYTGLTEYYGTWYYVVNGVLDWSVTTLTNYYGTWYYVENGVLNWNSDTLVNYYGVWYYTYGGVVAWDFAGVVEYYGAIYFVENGILNWNYTGFVELEDMYVYIENGVMPIDYIGFVEYEGESYLIVGGIYMPDYEGIIMQGDNLYLYINGGIDWSYTGIIQQFGYYFYVENGVVPTWYTGNIVYQGQTYYVQEGVVII